jgi:hypothetical protein
MARVVREYLKTDVNVPDGEMVQFTTALGAAILGQRRLQKMRAEGTAVSRTGQEIASLRSQ